jgi:hypothetical protein
VTANIPQRITQEGIDLLVRLMLLSTDVWVQYTYNISIYNGAILNIYSCVCVCVYVAAIYRPLKPLNSLYKVNNDCLFKQLFPFFSCRNLKAGFNSPGGYASVNHQHYHLYYLRERLYIETVVCIDFLVISLYINISIDDMI